MVKSGLKSSSNNSSPTEAEIGITKPETSLEMRQRPRRIVVSSRALRSKLLQIEAEEQMRAEERIEQARLEKAAADAAAGILPEFNPFENPIISLTDFVRGAWEELEPGTPLTWNWHIDCICAHLEAVSEGLIRRLLINVPPGHAKSMLVSVMWPAWVWLHLPNWRMLCASSGLGLAIRDSGKCKDLVMSQWYQDTFKPDWKIRTDTNAKQFYTNSATGMRRAVSVGAATTGFRGNVVAIDDALQVMDATSELKREEANRWVSKAAASRLANPQTGAIVMIMQRLHCLLPSSKINTAMGTIRADEICVGDDVLTSAGVQTVRNRWVHDHSGDVLHIKTFGHSESLGITPEHRLLTTEGWKEGKDLKVGDTLVYPLPQGETSCAELLRLWPALPDSSPPKKIHRVSGSRGRVPKDELVRWLGQGKSSREIAEIYGFKNRQSIDNYVAAYGLSRRTARFVTASAVTNPNFWRLVGYWLAEGCLGKGRRGVHDRVRLTFSDKETDFVEDLKSILAQYEIPLCISKAPGALQVSFASWQIAQFLEQFGVGANHKSLPEWAICLPKEFLQQLIIGYWRGDGCLDTKGNWRIASSSLDLLSGVQRALLRLGIVASVMAVRKKPCVSVIQSGVNAGQYVKGRVSWELRLRSFEAPWIDPTTAKTPVFKRAQQNQIDGNRLLVKIKSIEVDFYEGSVYDIETPCHDFVCNLITAHNCDDPAAHVSKKQGHSLRACVLALVF